MSDQTIRWCVTHNNSVTRSNRGRCDMRVMLPEDYEPLEPCELEDGVLVLGGTPGLPISESSHLEPDLPAHNNQDADE